MSDFIDGDEFDPEVAARAENAAYEARSDADDAVLAHIARTKVAYTRVFQSGNADPSDVVFVMKDLLWFSRADTHYFPDARVQDVMAGRKQVMQRVFEYTSLDRDTLFKRYVETKA